MVKKILKIGYLALILLFVYTPILILVVYSFTDSAIVGQWKGFSFALYGKLFADTVIMGVVRDTVLLAVGAAALSTVLGTVGAVGIFYSKSRAAAAVSGMSNIPIINAEIVTALALALFFAAFAPRSMFSLVVGHVVISVPFVVLSVLPKLKQMDPNLYEAALDLGATPAKAMFRIALPEILPGVLAGFMLAVTLSLDDYIVTEFTKPVEFKTISTYVYNALKTQNNSSLPALRALSALIFVGIVLVVVLWNINSSRIAKRRSTK